MCAPLAEYLGESAKIIDMIVDQSPEGLEVLRGSSTYIYDGNWKLQTENGADGYHVSSVHWNYAATTEPAQAARDGRQRPRHERRRLGQAGRRLLLASRTATCCSGPTGPTPRTGRLGPAATNSARSFGQARADWMIDQLAQPVPVPERLPDGPVQLADPRATGRSRSTRPKSPSTASRPRARAPRRAPRRIRQYEDFFNVTGMATPDDLEEFRACQIGYAGTRGALERHVAAAPSTGSKAPTRPPRRSA